MSRIDKLAADFGTEAPRTCEPSVMRKFDFAFALDRSWSLRFLPPRRLMALPSTESKQNDLAFSSILVFHDQLVALSLLRPQEVVDRERPLDNLHQTRCVGVVPEGVQLLPNRLR